MDLNRHWADLCVGQLVRPPEEYTGNLSGGQAVYFRLVVYPVLFAWNCLPTCVRANWYDSKKNEQERYFWIICVVCHVPRYKYHYKSCNPRGDSFAYPFRVQFHEDSS
jgi:hypothetical protein